jgi:hypothetical protein
MQMLAMISGRVIGEQKDGEYGFEFSIGESLPKNKDGTYQNNVVRVTVKDANDFIRKFVVAGAKVTVVASKMTLKPALNKEGNPVVYQQMYANAAYVKLDMPAFKKEDAEEAPAEKPKAASKKRAAAPVDDEIDF